MTPSESNGGHGQPSGEGFLDSHAFFASILMTMFAVAIVFSIIGFTHPSWLGFD